MLALVWMAVSGCTTTNYLSSDPQTSEDILRQSTLHGACVTLSNGISGNYYAVAIRKDSTRWQLTEHGKEVSVPTDSVACIKIANPQGFAGGFLGVIAGGLLGGVIGNALFVPTPPPPSDNIIEGVANGFGTAIGNGFGQLFSIVGGALLGATVGGVVGAVIGSTNATLYKTDMNSAAPETTTIVPDTTARAAMPAVDTAHVVPDTRVRKWVPTGFSTGFSQGHWEYIPSDTLHSTDTTQTKHSH